jgi:tryptophan synthase beta chain
VDAWHDAQADPAFRPSSTGCGATTAAGRRRCTSPAAVRGGRLEVWLKREDLAHTGSHKLNNVVGQALLARGWASRG